MPIGSEMGAKASHLHLTDERITSVASWRSALAAYIADGSRGFASTSTAATATAATTTAGATSNQPPLLPRVIAGLITEYLCPSLHDMMSHKSWVFVHCLGAMPVAIKSRKRVLKVQPRVDSPFADKSVGAPEADTSATGGDAKSDNVTLSFGYDRRRYQMGAGGWGAIIPQTVSFIPTGMTPECMYSNTLGMAVMDFKEKFVGLVRERVADDAALKIVAIMDELIDTTGFRPRHFNPASTGKTDESGLELTIAVRSREDLHEPLGRPHGTLGRVEFWLSWNVKSGAAVPVPDPLHLIFTVLTIDG